MESVGDWWVWFLEKGDSDIFELLSLFGLGAPGRMDFFLGIASRVKLARSGELSEECGGTAGEMNW